MGKIIAFVMGIVAWLAKNIALVVGILEAVVKVIAGIVSLSKTKNKDVILATVDKVFSAVKKVLYKISDMSAGEQVAE
ncbi:MAG: hypothetical protein M0R51_09645 [Clostridia bacterium]|jgi:hypothetical protein|nr:hypothetical protein [Clostridia bacterium]